MNPNDENSRQPDQPAESPAPTDAPTEPSDSNNPATPPSQPPPQDNGASEAGISLPAPQDPSTEPPSLPEPQDQTAPAPDNLPPAPETPAEPVDDEPAETLPDDDLGAPPEAEWHASEYIHHEKSPAWFAGLAAITVLGAAAAAFFRQWTFMVLIVVMGAAVGILARRPPREVHYQISREGISVGEKTFPFSQFRSFGVLNEGAFYSVQLRPVKRFMPGVSIFFAEADGEKIFDALAARLPAETVSQDPIDKLMRYIRF